MRERCIATNVAAVYGCATNSTHWRASSVAPSTSGTARRVADYRGIAQLVYSNARDGIAHDASPFDTAPPGIAADGVFFHLNGAGVERIKLAPEHLAGSRFRWRRTRSTLDRCSMP